MTAVDLAVLGVMLASGLLAFSRGLVREILSIGAWLGAAAVALEFLPAVRPLVESHMPSPEWTDPVGYIVLFLVSLILFTLIAKTIGGMVRTSAIGGIDRTLGLVFGVARGAALAVAAFIAASLAIPVDRWPEVVLDARSLPYIYNGAEWTVRQLPPEYQPKLQPPPTPTTTVQPALSTTPTGRAVDPPLHK